MIINYDSYYIFSSRKKNGWALRNILPFYSTSNPVKRKWSNKAGLAFVRSGWNRFGREENIISFGDCGAYNTEMYVHFINDCDCMWEGKLVFMQPANRRTAHSGGRQRHAQKSLPFVVQFFYHLSCYLSHFPSFYISMAVCVSLTFFQWLSVCCFCHPIKSHFHFAFNTHKLKFTAGLYFRTNSFELNKR